MKCLNVSPLSSLLSRPLVSIQLHCLPSSSYAAKAKSHPSGDGVQPHLPTSEFVCVDELWTYSAGMFFCGDYKGPYSDWEASTKLSHSNFFVSARLSGGDSLHSKHPNLPTTPLKSHHPPTPTPNCKPANPSGPPGILTEPNKSSGSKHEGFTVYLEYVFLTLELFVHSVFAFFGIILFRIHIFLSPRELQGWGSGGRY